MSTHIDYYVLLLPFPYNVLYQGSCCGVRSNWEVIMSNMLVAKYVCEIPLFVMLRVSRQARPISYDLMK